MTWKEQLRRATATPPPGARERVWKTLVAQPGGSSRRRRAWVLAPLALAAALAVFVATRTPEVQTFAGSNDVISLSEGHADWNPATNEVTLERGALEASVWGPPALRVHVRGRLIETSGAVLVVRTAGERVVIAPTRGSIVIDGERVDASEATRREAGVTTIERLEPPDASARRAAQALESKRWEEADRALEEVASSGSLGAEAALLQKGELELRTLRDPARALATFGVAAQRFPQGNLVQERELSSLEAEFALRHFEATAARAGAFLSAFPASERALDVRRLQVRALLEQGRAAEGCALASGLAEFSASCH